MSSRPWIDTVEGRTTIHRDGAGRQYLPLVTRQNIRVGQYIMAFNLAEADDDPWNLVHWGNWTLENPYDVRFEAYIFDYVCSRPKTYELGLVRKVDAKGADVQWLSDVWQHIKPVTLDRKLSMRFYGEPHEFFYIQAILLDQPLKRDKTKRVTFDIRGDLASNPRNKDFATITKNKNILFVTFDPSQHLLPVAVHDKDVMGDSRWIKLFQEQDLGVINW